jgi:hypothetical protein
MFIDFEFVRSCINPIVYAFMSKNFREAFKHIFGRIFTGKSTKPNPNVSNNFNNSIHRNNANNQNGRNEVELKQLINPDNKTHDEIINHENNQNS